MYKKTAIRKYFTEYLKTMIPTFFVYSGRIDKLQNDDISYPYLVVFNKNDSISEEFTSHTVREMDLIIGLVVSENQVADNDFDELIENAMFEVEAAMGLLITIPSTYIPTATDNFRLFEDITLKRSSVDSNNDGGLDIGTATMTYSVTYNYESPIVPISLDAFDVNASIENIQILNKGVLK